MGERTEPPSSSSERQQSNEQANDVHPARQTLLEESRATANQQLSQIAKIDDAAVRTVRMAFLLLGIVAGGSRLSFLDLGLVGAFGMWSLVGALFAGLFVYGTTRLFLGSSPDELAIDYGDEPTVKRAYVELIGRYENGIQFNRRILHTNGFALLVARLLLALAVVSLVLAFVRYVALSEEVVSTIRTFIW